MSNNSQETPVTPAPTSDGTDTPYTPTTPGGQPQDPNSENYVKPAGVTEDGTQQDAQPERDTTEATPEADEPAPQNDGTQGGDSPSA